MRRNERGSMAIEAVLLTPVLVAAIIMIATGSRYVDARSQANHAAYAAARAASLTTNQEAAVQAGRKAAEHSMAERGRACAGGARAGQVRDGLEGRVHLADPQRRIGGRVGERGEAAPPEAGTPLAQPAAEIAGGQRPLVGIRVGQQRGDEPGLLLARPGRRHRTGGLDQALEQHRLSAWPRGPRP